MNWIDILEIIMVIFLFFGYIIGIRYICFPKIKEKSSIEGLACERLAKSQNRIVVPDHEVPEAKPVKRIRRLESGTTDIAINKDELMRLERLVKKTLDKVKK